MKTTHRLLGPGSSVVVFIGSVVAGRIVDGPVVVDSPGEVVFVVTWIAAVVDDVTTAELVVERVVTPAVELVTC